MSFTERGCDGFEHIPDWKNQQACSSSMHHQAPETIDDFLN